MVIDLSHEARERLDLATPAICFFALTIKQQIEILPILNQEEKYDFPDGDLSVGRCSRGGGVPALGARPDRRGRPRGLHLPAAPGARLHVALATCVVALVGAGGWARAMGQTASAAATGLCRGRGVDGGGDRGRHRGGDFR